MYFYCYVYVFLLLFTFSSVYSVSLCFSMYYLCVNVYCTTATGCQPNCSRHIYHIISSNEGTSHKVKSAGGMKLTIHLQVLPSLRIKGALHPLLHLLLWRGV